MNKDLMNSAFTYGIVLIIVGIIGSKYQWKPAHIILIMGILFELAAITMYVYNKFKK